MTKKDRFLKYLDKVFEQGWDYFSVTIKTEGSNDNEVIVNPMCNYETKRAYYDKAYDADLVLKSFSGIKIVGYDAFCEEYTFNKDILSEEFYKDIVEGVE